MGQAPEILLVASARRFFLTLALLALSPAAWAAPGGRVDAEDYESFWVWAGIKPQKVLETARRLYLFQGERVRTPEGSYFRALGISPHAIEDAEVWLVFRSETLAWPVTEVASILALIRQWERRGTPVDGVQIDFDARSHALPAYAAFLRQLRAELPGRYGLSVTGLLDWSTSGSVAAINGLQGTLDEIVIQTYRGRQTVANYADYLPALERLCLPFRIGLVQHGQWERSWEARLANNSFYRGVVVFLVNQECC